EGAAELPADGVAEDAAHQDQAGGDAGVGVVDGGGGAGQQRGDAQAVGERDQRLAGGDVPDLGVQGGQGQEGDGHQDDAGGDDGAGAEPAVPDPAERSGQRRDRESVV